MLNGLNGCAAGAGCEKVGVKSCCVNADEGVARDEADDGGENGPVTAFCQ
jgi:hypothetical protein